MSSFSRLVRFLAKDGRTYYGDAILPRGVTDISKAKQAKIIRGEIFGNTICLGLNYEQHAKESHMPIPKFPVLFYKPVTPLTGPTDPIPIHPLAQKELVWTTSSIICPWYSIGNDVSHRDWQIKHGGGQWSLGKGFDGWAQYGPGIVNSNIINDPQNLRISTKINGKMMQDSNTKDMIFGVAKTIAFLSQGITLLPGDLIFTGTLQGVGLGRKPQVCLKVGDVVEVGLEGVGTSVNKAEFTRKTESRL
ncbi:Fumarylacetoacetase-like protein [Amylocarpus encephaloides]|uniref:Fumarylacetoacetase-like protein n=1 Tax=Amylocarpus encephaloides TaxID=45428 RepID=A0A9P7YRP7_9HELO|nr:Fumarylacetoacetase-like protein [Amylocarpus encephaloides]